jgi:hypothetical protein
MITIQTIQDELYDKYYGQFHQILLERCGDHYRVEVDLYELAQYNPYLVALLRKKPDKYITLFDEGTSI